jgi:hypothetical protein
MAWVAKDATSTPVNTHPSLGVTVQTHIESVKGIELKEGSFFQQCSVLQHDEVQIQGRQTNLADFALFEPIMFYVKGPSVYAVATACSLEGHAIRTAAFYRSEEMVMRACDHHFDMRDERMSSTLTNALKILFTAKPDPAWSTYYNSTGNIIPAHAAASELKHIISSRVVSAMRLATRILRGTRAQISDIHARATAQREFGEVIESICFAKQ